MYMLVHKKRTIWRDLDLSIWSSDVRRTSKDWIEDIEGARLCVYYVSNTVLVGLLEYCMLPPPTRQPATRQYGTRTPVKC